MLKKWSFEAKFWGSMLLVMVVTTLVFGVILSKF